jgi:threonine dehydrogenase-like Zn-dependent dehydrogenase
MRAVVTSGQGVMEVVDVPAPGDPGPGEVIVRPEAVGICGSDFHFFLGELGDGSEFPNVQGHEVGATVEAVGPDCVRGLTAGDAVALHPLSSCGHCYPCRIGRGNVCDNFSLIGIHEDGGLQELLRIPEAQVFPTSERRPEIAALAEPLSIAVRAVDRARIEAGEHVVVLGAGPIGQALTLLAQARGASVLLIDRLQGRLDIGAGMGAEVLPWSDDVVELAREWSGGEGSEVVMDATGVPDAIRAGVDAAASAGRVVIVGMSHHDVPLRVFTFTEKELDVLGVSCCQEHDFAEAVSFVEANSARLESLITHEFPFERAPEALRWAMEHPGEAMKVIIK